MTFQTLIEKYENIQKSYEEKSAKLTFWEENFKKLEQSVETLSTEIQAKYEATAVPNDLPEDLREKLENRLEGIRLSAKSASRLVRKLNPDKPVRSGEFPVVEERELLADLSRALGTEQVESIEKLLEQLESDGDTNSNESFQDDEIKETAEMVQPGDLEQEDQVIEETPMDSSDELAEPVQDITELVQETVRSEVEISGEVVSSEQDPLGDDVKDIPGEQKLPEMKNDAERSAQAHSIIDEAVKSNVESLEELQENLESVEKRFCNFIEKSIGPVMDGLHSGKKHGSSLITEMNEAEANESEQAFVEEWMSVYDDMMNSITALFHQYSVALYEPRERESFNENVQEPIAVVEDHNFKDEEIKEVVRFGLRYNEPIFDQPSFLIRPAQVIVVKNKLADTSGEMADAEGSAHE